jgi:oligoribonuclease NrnB/cAMP/cGMP phosphodiesterase (DHH superfamily)
MKEFPNIHDMLPLLVIYHGNCADGFGAAWSIWEHSRYVGYFDKVEFYPAIHGREPPSVEGKHVLFVDFSYKRPVIEKMLEEALSVSIIDHHKTAIEDLQPLVDAGKIAAVFDTEHSGAMLTWMHFFPELEPPELIKRIEDRDLWRFKFEDTREIQANVFSHPYDFAVWTSLMYENIENLRKEGTAIERKHFKDIKELIDVCKRRMKIGGWDVPVANMPYTLSSVAGHEMAEHELFAACYWDTPAGRVFSLRSSKEGLDVSEIAKQYGGGGHMHAAGFQVPYGHELTR